MIKFFRNIRQTLIKENKTSNYFKYAIGEIALVVIGILIALQINNWNEQKKADQFELKMLAEIKKSIVKDNTYLQFILEERVKVIDSNCAVLKKMLKQNKIDSVEFNKNLLGIGFGFIFQYSDGAYEALKASGIDKVTNDSLRNELIQFYDFVGPRTTQLIDFHSNENYRQSERELSWEIFEYDVVSIGDIGLHIAPIRYKLDNYRDSRLLQYLQLRSTYAANGGIRIRNYIRDSDKLRSLLEKELNKREND